MTRRLITLLCVLSLFACSPVYKTTHEYIKPKTNSGLSCIKQCQKSRSVCQRLCRADQPNCEQRAKEQAQFEFNDYVAQQGVAGKPVRRDLNSYYDPLQCSKSSCDCDADYQACYQMCGGEIVPHEKCVAHCDKI